MSTDTTQKESEVESEVQIDDNDTVIGTTTDDDISASASASASASDSDSDSDSDSESESEDEPKFKYSRLDLKPPIFTNSVVSAFLATDRIIVFATHSGILHLFNPDMTSIRSFPAHRASILSLSTDGNYLASGSLDGTVVIGSITDQSDISAADFKRPIHAVALDPNYKNSRAYISAGTAGNVVYSERNWLGRRSDTVLYSSDEPIVSLHWFKNIIIWMNDDGIMLYSTIKKSILKHIKRPPNSPRAGLNKPRICFPDSNRIYIAWVNYIWNIKISVEKPTSQSFLASGAASVLSSHPDEIIDIETVCQLDWLISGILPFKDNVMILTFAKKDTTGLGSRKTVRDPPELKLIDWNGEEVYADVLSMKSYQGLAVDDYHLGYFSGNKALTEKYLIVSATDAIVAEQRTLNDSVEWLIEHKLFQKCWEMSNNIIDPIRRLGVGINHVESLIDKDEWKQASLFLKLVLSADSIPNPVLIEEWDRWGWIFIKSNHIIELAPILPIDEEDSLVKQEIYDKIISFCLENDKSMLIKLMYNWPTSLYNSNLLKNEIEDLLNEKELTNISDNSLRMALADLYTTTNDPLSALHHLLILHHVTVIDHISKYHLLPQIHAMIAEIFTYNLSQDELQDAPLDVIRDKTKEAVQLFVQGRHQILPEVVIKNLSTLNLDIILFLYLEELNKKDSFIAKSFGDLQVKLYAEFDRNQLIGFFSRNNNYSLNKALEICEKNNYIPELVYLLGKVGQNQKALRLIIEKIGDPEQALEFATSQNDKDLWNDLIHYSLKNPLFIRVLLEKGNGSIDPIRIIKDIPPKTTIPGLKEALLKLFKDNEVLKSLNIGALDIIKAETATQSDNLRKIQLKGDPVDFTNSPLDLSLPYILTPERDLKTEQELIGKKVPSWVDEGTTDNPPVWSITLKVNHLAYILRNLRQ